MTDQPGDSGDRDLTPAGLPTLPRDRRSALPGGVPAPRATPEDASWFGAPEGAGEADDADESWGTRHRLLTWLTALAGVLLAAGGTWLVLTAPGPADDAGDVPVAVGGADGAYPGGPAVRAELALVNATSTTLHVTGVRVDTGALPAGCPAAAWTVGTPAGLPTVTPGGDGSVPLPVALRSDAPESCQGRMVIWSAAVDAVDDAGRSTHLAAVGGVTTATLGSPGVAVRMRDGHAVVTPMAPSGGPAPESFTVDVVTGGTTRRLCQVDGRSDCTDAATPRGTTRRYVVTAALGTGWSRSSAAVELDGTES